MANGLLAFPSLALRISPRLNGRGWLINSLSLKCKCAAQAPTEMQPRWLPIHLLLFLGILWGPISRKIYIYQNFIAAEFLVSICDVIKGTGAPTSHPARCLVHPLRPPYGCVVLSSSKPANKSIRRKEGKKRAELNTRCCIQVRLVSIESPEWPGWEINIFKETR